MANDSKSLSKIIANIDEAWRLSRENQSARIVAVVSGSSVDKKAWQKNLEQISPHIFNRDKSTLVLSLQEKTGRKTREGNFLGTLLAYRYIKTSAESAGIQYKDFVTMIGMLFGRGERISPITQAKGCRKPDIEVTPKIIDIDGSKKAFSAIEEALLYFTPVVKYLEKGGFRGILNKWGDETEIASVDLTRHPGEKKFSKYDLIKFVKVIEVTQELARQKDWVVFDEENNMVAQLSRNEKNVVQEELKKLGIKPKNNGKYYAGVSLGPAAVSYEVLDIASKIFAKEIEKQGVHFDFDPYFLMALAMRETGLDKWYENVKKDEGLNKLVSMIPDFFEKVQEIKCTFKNTYGRNLNLKVFDLGENTYWVDIGQHKAMREKFLSLAGQDEKGVISRKISRIPEKRDENGNIIINSQISSEVRVSDSTIINSIVKGRGVIKLSVILDTELYDPDVREAFAVRSKRLGRTILKENSGIYESLGKEPLTLEKGMRHVSVLTASRKLDMRVSEETNLRDKEKTYNVPIFGNDISFKNAYDKMFGTSKEEIEKRRAEIVMNLQGANGKKKKPKELTFGTSGLRDEVRFMTDKECFINSRGFIEFLKEKGEITEGAKIALGGDRRQSTPRIMNAVSCAIESAGCKTVFCGLVPSPVLALYAIQNKMPSIMVTGSHIPEDRNGIKFTKSSGEVLKSDEQDILRNVKSVREKPKKELENISFKENGMFEDEKPLPEPEFEQSAVKNYVNRYIEVFGESLFAGKRIVLYQHSAVGRDIISKIFKGLGAEVVSAARSERFVPVDTEKVSEETRRLLKQFAEQYKPFAVISTDGDSDRPLLADEKGNFLTGDKLGALVSMYLKPDFAAIPISANDAITKALTEKGVKVVHTKIGSPYVIKAMMDELVSRPFAKVVSWESNGGFLLGNDWDINGKKLMALPTRDAVLPLISVLMLAEKESKSISELIMSALPARYTHADVVDNKTKGCEDYTALMGKTIIKMFSPLDKTINQADFSNEKVEVHYQDGRICSAEKDSATKLEVLKNRLEKYFNKAKGFERIVSINWIDGIRMVFENGDVSHIRPSGNAPEFRNYATADTQERANEIVEKRFKILPEIIRDLR